ncbi:MAG: histidine kinase [Chloroflexi bacterium]|nr:histidine kinase [Chloroflexota bacterium]
MPSPLLSNYLTHPSPGVLTLGGARMAFVDIESGFWSLRRQLETLLGESAARAVFQQAGADGGASYAAAQGRAEDPQTQRQLFADCLRAYQAAGFGQFEILAENWLPERVTVCGRETFEAWMMSRHGQRARSPVCAYTAGVLVGFLNVVSQRRDVVCIERHCQARGDEACEFDLLPASQAEGQSVIAFTPDPALGKLPEKLDEPQLRETLIRLTENEALLRSVVENARHFAIYRVTLDPASPYGARLTLASPSIRELTGVDDYYDFSNWFKNLHPEDAPRVLEANRRALEQGEPYNQVTRVYHPRQGRWRWVQTVSNPGYDSNGRLTHFDGMVIDLTEQKEAELALQEMNATLEARVQARTEEIERRRATAESLRDIIRMINSNLPLDDFLQQAVELAAKQLGAGACVLHHIDLEQQVVTQTATYGMEGIFEKRSSRPFSAMKPSGGEGYLQALLARQPIYGNYPPLPERVDEIRRDPDIPEAIKRERIALRERYAGSFAVPLYIQDKLYGGMVFYYAEPQEFHEEQIQLGLAFAEQMAVALENAFLRERVALAERSRLARDLHDAVSQTLFSASLIAEALPKLWQRSPETAAQKLEELRQLTRGALSEMRTLLFELRPAALSDTELSDLLRHLANAFTARARLPVELNIEGQPDPPAGVKAVFYRVAQEALNNAAKYAQARQVALHLSGGRERLRLEIRDDGRGFDPLAVPPDSLGLNIMRERAESIGASLQIRSAPEQGTIISLDWTSPRQETL